MDISIIFKEEKLMRALMGIGIEEFRRTAISLDWALRSDLVAKGIREALDSGFHLQPHKHIRLFFIIFYLRFHPSQNLSSFLFGISIDQVRSWVKMLLPSLSRILHHDLQPATHKIESLPELLSIVPEIQELLGVGHMIQRTGKLASANDNLRAKFNNNYV